uniref:uncharacterized protein LOC132686429 isoform X2 n=1 Tax=Panthera onca TaxID=9690 RepID=UPI0029534A65|nr:uncharacterized protein LOC132686429 isoform X2 [Panthera onca]
MCQRSPSWFCPLERHLGVQPTSLPQSGGPEEAGLCHSWGMEEKKQPLLLQNHFTLLFLWPRVSVTGPSLSPALTSSQGAFPDTTLLRCGDSGEQHCDFCPPQTGRQGDRRKLHTQAPIAEIHRGSREEFTFGSQGYITFPQHLPQRPLGDTPTSKLSHSSSLRSGRHWEKWVRSTSWMALRSFHSSGLR